MKPAVLIRKSGQLKFTALSCLKLASIGIMPSNNRSDSRSFAISLLRGQMDFIQSLHDYGTDYRIELRYLFLPDHPYKVEVYFLVQTADSDRKKIEEKSVQLASNLLRLVKLNNSFHQFEPVADQREVRRLHLPFKPHHIAEIVRREDTIPLDTVRTRAAKRLGFQAVKCDENSSSLPDETPLIYFVFPYAVGLDNMERVCSALISQSAPCLISVCLRPVRLTEDDAERLEQRCTLCEKYSQLSFSNEFSQIIQLKPFLVKQANIFYEHCSREHTLLQDAAFLQKVQIASPQPISREMITITGSALTEHSGHPRDNWLTDDKGSLSGGYDWFVPKTRTECDIAYRNLKNMKFDQWIPSLAPANKRHWRYLFDVSQANAAFRLPIPVATEFPGISTRQYQQRPAPATLPDNGILLGEHPDHRGNRRVYFNEVDRLRHAYVVGQTGTGKSTFFLNMILQDIKAGNGVAVIDPHGELIEDILPCIPSHRAGDVVYINPKDYDYPVGINMLDNGSPFERDFCINYLLDVFDTLYDLKATGGPIFEMYMRNALQLLLEQSRDYTPSVIDIPILLRDPDFRRWLLKGCRNEYVVDFWRKEAEKAGGDAALANIVPYISSKLTRFVNNDVMRGIVGQRESSISFRSVMDRRMILLVDLRKGILGDMNSHFLGMIVVGKIFTAAMSRTNSENKHSLPNFYLYVDEFQNLATPTFVSILSEARKYQLSLTITNQYIAQLKDYIIQGILGNVGTLISMRVGFADAALLSKEFGGAVSELDLQGLPNYVGYARLLSRGNICAPFNLHTILPERHPDITIAKRICESSRQAFGRKRAEAEAQIRRQLMGEEAGRAQEQPSHAASNS